MRIHFTNINQDLPLFCENIGYDWHQENVQRPKGYYYYHWLQSQTGTGIFMVDNQRFVLGPNQGILLEPNVPHSYQAKVGETWQTSFLVFSGAIAGNMMTYLGVNRYLYVRHIQLQLSQFIQKSFGIFETEDLESTYAQSEKLYEFLLLLKRNVQHQATSSLVAAIVQPIINYININYANKITNSDLSRYTGYSVAYQNKIFLEYYQQTPLQYLTAYRLRKAKSFLLVHPEWPIQTIGNRVGFDDISHFTQYFRQYTGKTPSAFRKDR
ncbi:two-component sensor response regulator [Agrilactobacillus composti DSM 18527 = JCM 14202]|uniref:Two-component sensor response regulator n=1 Tax=Agrilactobacillus composti DSM 18527 = JCM 14202 TaxID=1423734 RepID=A0A0R1XTC4_9LACO|nr:AraC family transcriptional regulator [Agrilactobacillus composti]KRM33423.1 two-component sensor response regulator [Agrilactobacillus composti DSM 18527 = JCM 14202]